MEVTYEPSIGCGCSQHPFPKNRPASSAGAGFFRWWPDRGSRVGTGQGYCLKSLLVDQDDQVLAVVPICLRGSSTSIFILLSSAYFWPGLVQEVGEHLKL